MEAEHYIVREVKHTIYTAMNLYTAGLAIVHGLFTIYRLGSCEITTRSDWADDPGYSEMVLGSVEARTRLVFWSLALVFQAWLFTSKLSNFALRKVRFLNVPARASGQIYPEGRQKLGIFLFRFLCSI